MPDDKPGIKVGDIVTVKFCGVSFICIISSIDRWTGAIELSNVQIANDSIENLKKSLS